MEDIVTIAWHQTHSPFQATRIQLYKMSSVSVILSVILSVASGKPCVRVPRCLFRLTCLLETDVSPTCQMSTR